MAVGTFDQPDHEQIGLSGTDYKKQIDNSVAAMARIGAMFAAHEQDTPDMTVRVDAGALWIDGAITEVAAQSSATITAPSSNPRYDRVVISSTTGAVSVVAGVEHADPDPPSIPSGYLPICRVYLTTSTTEITNQELYDERTPSSFSESTSMATDGEAEARVVTTKTVAPSQLKYGGGLVLIEKKDFTSQTLVTFSGLEAGVSYRLTGVVYNASTRLHVIRINLDSGSNYLANSSCISYSYSTSAVYTGHYYTTTTYIQVTPLYALNTYPVILDLVFHPHPSPNTTKLGVTGTASFYGFSSGFISAPANAIIGTTYNGAATLGAITYTTDTGTVNLTGKLLLYKFMED